MVEEVDSLDHIKALLNTSGDNNGIADSQDREKNRSFEEPTYQISSSNNGGHIGSFGASSRLAQVVDPNFRAPATQEESIPNSGRVFGQNAAHVASPAPSLAQQVYTLSSRQTFHQQIHSSAPQNNSGFTANSTVPQQPPSATNSNEASTSSSFTNIADLANKSSSVSMNQASTTTTTTTTTIANSTSSIPGLDIVEHQPCQMPQDQLAALPTSTPAATSVPFGSSLGPTSTTSFSDLARNTANNLARANTLGDTLREYGPPVTIGQGAQPFRTVPTVQSNINMRPGQHMHPPVNIHRNDVRAYNSYQIAQRSSVIMSNQQQPGARPVVFIPSNNNLAQSLNNMTTPRNRNNNDRDAPIYSPQPPSPPLDRINNQPNNSTNVHPINSLRSQPNQPQSSQGAASIGNRIPKKQGLPTNNDKYDEYSMIDLIEKHKECRKKVAEMCRQRTDIEKLLNDLTRSSQGRNLEMDKNFRAKKDEQRRINETIDELKSKQKKIADKLLSKYDHRVVDDKPAEPVRGMNKKQQRVKMSTGADRTRLKPPSEDFDETSKNRRKLVFSLRSSSLWCKLCDIHFDNLKEFCEHLHKKDHQKNMRNSDLPWRKSKESIDRSRTYDLLKSICLAVANERGIDNFSLISYDEALNPTLENKKSKLKELSNKRERGRFPDDDPLFSLKGYENIVPIKGFYCQLCDSTYCDAVAIEQHIKGYEHNYLHAKSVATDSSSEETFRSLQIKSLKRQNINTVDEPVVEQTVSESNKSCDPYIPHYKKPTSHIVDQHDVIANKFSNKPAPLDKEKAAKSLEIITNHNSDKPVKRPENPYATKTVLDSDSDLEPVEQTTSKTRSPRKRQSGRKVPEIVPLKDTRKPSALTRLKRTSHKEITPQKQAPYYASTDTESADNDVEILNEIHMNIGDPDSPFPHLDLVVTGNAHMNMLKDPKLSRPPKVSLKRINLDDYKDQLLDASSLWNRVNFLMAKKEPARLESVKNNLREKVSTKPAYLDSTGKPIPIDINEASDEDEQSNDRKSSKRKILDSDSEQEEKPKLEFLIDDVIASIEQQSSKEPKLAEGDDEDVACDRSTTNEGDESFHMSLLEDFFCEKPK